MADVLSLNQPKKNLIQRPMDVTSPSAPDVSLPPELLDALNTPSLSIPKAPPPEQAASPDFPIPQDTSLPKAPVDLSPDRGIPPPAPILKAMDNSQAVTDLASAPPPNPPVTLHKSLAERYLPLLGVIGAGLEAAGNPNRPPEGAMLLQRAYEGQANRALEQRKLEEVEAPQAQAHARYWEEFNPTKLAISQAANEAKLKSTAINKRFVSVPNVGLFDTAPTTGPVLVPGSSPAGVTVTADIAKDWTLPPQMIGKFLTSDQFSRLESAATRNFTMVQGAKGPAREQKIGPTGDLGLGAPSVAARQSGVVDVEQNGQIVPMTDAQRLAASAPRASTMVSVGKAENQVFAPAIDADTRLKQMYEQAANPSGAADMALLFNHIAMTGGNVKGMRMGTFLTEEHRKARSIPEDLGVLWNHVVAGQVLSPQQRVNFVKLAESVRQTRWDQARREASMLGVTGNEPVPDPELPALRSLQGGMNQVPLNTPQPPKSPATPPPAKAIPVYDKPGGRQIGTATPEQQKRGTYTPLRPR